MAAGGAGAYSQVGSFVAIKAILVCTENQDIGLVIDALQVRKLGLRELEF